MHALLVYRSSKIALTMVYRTVSVQNTCISSIYNVEQNRLNALFNNHLDIPSSSDMEVIANRQIESNVFDVIGNLVYHY